MADEKKTEETTTDQPSPESRIKSLFKEALKEFVEENKPAPKRTEPKSESIFNMLFGG